MTTPTFWATIRARVTEPSTWASASALAVGASTQLPPSTQIYVLSIAALCAGMGVIMRERGTKSAQEVAADALAAAGQVEAKK
jgi:hypothetical protein